jgi:hypothetical protein
LIVSQRIWGHYTKGQNRTVRFVAKTYRHRGVNRNTFLQGERRPFQPRQGLVRKPSFAHGMQYTGPASSSQTLETPDCSDWTLVMDGTIAGYLIDAMTGEVASSSEVSLTRHGVLGQSLTRADGRGRFAFTSLPSGKYSLGVHDNRYAPLYRKLFLKEQETIENLEIALTPAAFIKGRILDDEGRPPQHCHVTLIKEGTRNGRSGYISDSGDHEVAQDGRFSSPPLHPGRYFLRFAGILRKPLASTPSQVTHEVIQQRIFDFLCLNAQEIRDARAFDLQTGQTVTDLEVHIPSPIWRTVRGRVTGALPEGSANIYVHFTRDVGMLDDFGSAGTKVNADGTFKICAQPGRHRLRVWEMAPPKPDGHTKMTKQFASTEVIVGDCDLDEVEIEVAPPAIS